MTNQKPKCKTCGGSGISKKCPQCGENLMVVKKDALCLMNEDQFNSTRAGDYYCSKCPDNNRGKSRMCYWWERELPSCPDCQQPKGELVGLIKMLEIYAETEDPVSQEFYQALCTKAKEHIEQQAARIEELEKALEEIASWTMYSGVNEYAKGDYSHSYYLMESEIFAAKKIAKAALGEKEQKNERE